jgi:hypothetical protein
MTTDVQVSTGFFRVEITATTDITAPPEHVWRILTDTTSYPLWNPFVKRLDGELAVGRRVTVDLQPGRRPPQTLHPRIVEFSAGRGFTWLGHVGFPGVLDGRHRFTVEPSAGGGTRLVQQETLSGAPGYGLRADDGSVLPAGA